MLVSIILPVHNQADHIGEIVQGYVGALSECIKDYELILVANACTDNSPAVCQDLSNKEARVKLVQTEKSGWGKAVKLGLKEAKGEIVCYTNSACTSAQKF